LVFVPLGQGHFLVMLNAFQHDDKIWWLSGMYRSAPADPEQFLSFDAVSAASRSPRQASLQRAESQTRHIADAEPSHNSHKRVTNRL
jgi:hypothetical protein